MWPTAINIKYNMYSPKSNHINRSLAAAGVVSIERDCSAILIIIPTAFYLGLAISRNSCVLPSESTVRRATNAPKMSRRLRSSLLITYQRATKYICCVCLRLSLLLMSSARSGYLHNPSESSSMNSTTMSTFFSHPSHSVHFPCMRTSSVACYLTPYTVTVCFSLHANNPFVHSFIKAWTMIGVKGRSLKCDALVLIHSAIHQSSAASTLLQLRPANEESSASFLFGP